MSAEVITLGETMGLLHSTHPSPLAHTSNMALSIGGAESNVAIALRRLGTSSAWVGRVGDDSLGERVVRELYAERIEVHATVDTDAPTGLMLKEHRTASSTRVWYYRAGSAGSRLCVDDLPLSEIRAARVLHITGITPALSASAAAAVRLAVAEARAAGVAVSFDVNHRSTLWKGKDPGEAYRAIAATSTIVFAGEDEARIMFPDAVDLPDLAARVADLGAAQVVIKRGGDGCFALVDGIGYRRDAIPVSVVDTVGAGDAFVAGYLAEFVQGSELQDRLTTAVTVGAFNCLAPGDWEGLPRRAELSLLTATEPVVR
jgi:2-dehydro-3-deoxygluconokinase